jgi:hypothetical protein
MAPRRAKLRDPPEMALSVRDLAALTVKEWLASGQ